MEISLATHADLEQILKLQKLCFQEHAEFYNDFEMAPMTETLHDLELNFENFVIIKASVGAEIIGSVRACEKDETCFIGRLIVHPDYQNQGIGKKLMFEIENKFSRAQRFELFTGWKDEKNLYFYEKIGYSQFKIKKTDAGYSLVYLEKPSRLLQTHRIFL